jgi:hypothetical protein
MSTHPGLEFAPPPPSPNSRILFFPDVKIAMSPLVLFIISMYPTMHTAISIKVVHEQSAKVEYEREKLLGIANKLMNFQSDFQQPFALVFDFSALLVDNLN